MLHKEMISAYSNYCSPYVADLLRPQEFPKYFPNNDPQPPKYFWPRDKLPFFWLQRDNKRALVSTALAHARPCIWRLRAGAGTAAGFCETWKNAYRLGMKWAAFGHGGYGNALARRAYRALCFCGNEVAAALYLHVWANGILSAAARGKFFLFRCFLAAFAGRYSSAFAASACLKA